MSSLPPTARLADVDAERLLLSGLLKAADMVLPVVLEAGVMEADLTDYRHRLVWRAAVDLAGTGAGDVGVYSVFLVLKCRKQLADLGPHPARWLGELWFDDPTGCWCDWAAHRVRAMTARRETVRRASKEIEEALRETPRRTR